MARTPQADLAVIRRAYAKQIMAAAGVPYERVMQAFAIYVNAGVTHPLASWLDRLRDGGRIVLPMTAAKTKQTPESGRWAGFVFLIRRRDEEFSARMVSQVAIYPCEGARNRRRNGHWRVRSRPAVPSTSVISTGTTACPRSSAG
ncbi:MAG: hypothetical protein AAF637_26290 [Pseudomonadota bacterium]